MYKIAFILIWRIFQFNIIKQFLSWFCYYLYIFRLYTKYITETKCRLESCNTDAHTYTYTRLTAPFLGLPR